MSVAIKEVTFYFANPQQDENGDPVIQDTPESHTLTWKQVQDNAGFSLSTGENLYTELPDPNNDHLIRIINGLYFGSGIYGSLLAIQYHYEDGTVGWIDTIINHSTDSVNLDQIVGNWIKGLSYEEITQHENWLGKPYIGYENNFVEVSIRRYLPEISVSLSPLEKTIYRGETVTFQYSSSDYCEGETSYRWLHNLKYVETVTLTETEHTMLFTRLGDFEVAVSASNECGQIKGERAVIHVLEPPEQICDLELTPDTISIRVGETATFDCIHSQVGTGTWSFDQTSLEALVKDQKQLQVKGTKVGSYLITYTINDCQTNSMLYVIEGESNEDWEDPVEPSPPPLPETPPETGGTAVPEIELVDASKPIPPLYRYPNIMKRNARYRGHRESEKFLHDHQEQIYDIRKHFKQLSELTEKELSTIQSWFHGIENNSISIKTTENKKRISNTVGSHSHTRQEGIRALEEDMIQLSGNNFEDRIVGIYGIRQKMKELDERIAEAERRYKKHENAYK